MSKNAYANYFSSSYGSNVASANVHIRLGFLRKVYGIVSAQLLFTTFVGALFILCEPVKAFVQGSSMLFYASAIASLALIFAMNWKSKETPTNYVLLTLFTGCESVLVGTVVTFYNPQVVLGAFLLTCAVTLALTIYTLQSKKDFSSWGAGLFSMLWVLMLASFMQLFLRSPRLDFFIAVGSAVLFSLYIVYDTHMIMHKVSAEQYIHASITLYLDVINLFLDLLRILNDLNDRKRK
ncbi:Protein lifeguard 4 [Lamellibrachia satsuma]|nr:Protein lifeguard 4 [Lamellibrachia satsuma]